MNASLESFTLKAVATQMSEAVVLADTSGRVTWVNEAFKELCGYSTEEILGESPGRLLQGEDTEPNTVRKFHVALKNGTTIQADILNYHKDGHAYWARVSITPLRDPRGRLQGFMAIERDVTENHEDIKELHGEVVELYATVLREEYSRGLKLRADDPFFELIEGD